MRLFRDEQGMPGRPDDAVQRLPIRPANQFPGSAGLQIDHGYGTAAATITTACILIVADCAGTDLMGAIQITPRLPAAFVDGIHVEHVGADIQVQVAFARYHALLITLGDQERQGVDIGIVFPAVG